MLTNKRDFTLDWLKAISISLVIIYHLQPIQLYYHETRSLAEKIIAHTIHLINSHIFSLAVPVFFLTSLYLFISKLRDIDITDQKNYLLGRFKRIFGLYIFYFSIQVLLFMTFINYLPSLPIPEINHPEVNAVLKNPIILIIENFWSGGPPLPFISYSVFYFLLDLSIVTCLAFYFNKLSIELKRILSIVIISLTCLYFEIAPIIGHTIYAYRIENFLIYIPIANLWVNSTQSFLNYRRAYLFGFLLFSLHDQILMKYNWGGALYSRVSVVLGALALIGYAYNTATHSPCDRIP